MEEVIALVRSLRDLYFVQGSCQQSNESIATDRAKSAGVCRKEETHPDDMFCPTFTEKAVSGGCLHMHI